MSLILSPDSEVYALESQDYLKDIFFTRTINKHECFESDTSRPCDLSAGLITRQLNMFQQKSSRTHQITPRAHTAQKYLRRWRSQISEAGVQKEENNVIL